MQKPNTIWHMMRWGFGGGTILALLYIFFIIGLNGLNTVDILSLFLQPFLWGIALSFGGGSGAILGLLDGLILWALTRNVPIPFTRADMQAIRYKVYAWIGIVTTIAGFALTSIFFFYSMLYLWFLLLFPPIIAGFAAAYAGHRYLFRLRLWSERNYGGQKEKAKNVERLEDKPKNEVLYDDEEEADNQAEQQA